MASEVDKTFYLKEKFFEKYVCQEIYCTCIHVCLCIVGVGGGNVCNIVNQFDQEVINEPMTQRHTHIHTQTTQSFTQTYTQTTPSHTHKHPSNLVDLWAVHSAVNCFEIKAIKKIQMSTELLSECVYLHTHKHKRQKTTKIAQNQRDYRQHTQGLMNTTATQHCWLSSSSLSLIYINKKGSSCGSHTQQTLVLLSLSITIFGNCEEGWWGGGVFYGLLHMIWCICILLYVRSCWLLYRVASWLIGGKRLTNKAACIHTDCHSPCVCVCPLKKKVWRD